jgi:hypothetical protein
MDAKGIEVPGTTERRRPSSGNRANLTSYVLERLRPLAEQQRIVAQLSEQMAVAVTL